jgi:hypothetical protein
MHVDGQHLFSGNLDFDCVRLAAAYDFLDLPARQSIAVANTGQ